MTLLNTALLSGAFAQIDRLIAGDGLLPSDITSYVLRLQAALGIPNSIALDAANRLLQLKGQRVFLFTGFVVPALYPRGENDGPLGTLALARALDRCGLIPTVWVDPQLLDTSMWLAAELGIEFSILPIDLDALEELRTTVAAAIAIEKPGRNASGVMHTFDGSAIEDGSVPVDNMFLQWLDAGILTIGIGDRGNEVGFGLLHEVVLQMLPSSASCQCGCRGGVVSNTNTQLLVPAAVSNWGAYGIAAALAIVEKNDSLLYLPDEERRLLHVAAVRGCVDGVHRRGGFGVDGLGGDVSIALVARLRDLAQAAIDGVEIRSACA